MNCSTIPELLQWRATISPHKHAFTFVNDDDALHRQLTWSEVHERARQIASALIDSGSTSQRVLLLLTSSEEFVLSVFGCLYAGAIAVPAYTLSTQRLARTASRLRHLLQDAQPQLILSDGASQRLATTCGVVDEFSDLNWEMVADFKGTTSATEMSVARCPDDTAVLQYTSGSVTAPKGVILSHQNILANQQMICEAHEFTEDSTLVNWIPLAHDWGLMNSVFQPLYCGATSVIMSPEAFLQKPARWLNEIAKHHRVGSGGPPFAYELCLSRIDPASCEELDLAQWLCAGVAAGPIRADTLERFAAAFAPCGFRREAFYAGYGLAEATVLVSDSPASRFPTVTTIDRLAIEMGQVRPAADGQTTTRFVGCGTPPACETVLIVNPDTCIQCNPSEVGEIWIAGPHVARGYWNHPTESKQTFGAVLADSGVGPFLRTGDLGFFRDQELFICGRLKDLIIIRGRNLYPSDIEATVDASHTAVRPGGGTAFGIELGDGEHVIIVQEIRSDTPAQTVDTVIGAIRRAIFVEHDVVPYAVMLVQPGTLPKTSSGKPQRTRCRELYTSGALSVIRESVLSRLDGRT